MPTIPGTDEQRQALETQIKLFRAAEALRDALRKFWSQGELTEKQFETLQVLYLLGPLPCGQIAEKLFCLAGNVSTIVDNLEDKNLVERKRREDDRRVVEVHLTPKAQETIKELLPHYVEELETHFQALTLEEQEELARLCKKLGTRIGE